MLHIIDQQNSLLNKFIAELRDVNIQKDSMRFRRNMERIGEIAALEVSKTLNYHSKIVETPLGKASVMTISDTVVLATILRAGLPFHQGFSTTSTMPRTHSCRHTARAPSTASS